MTSTETRAAKPPGHDADTGVDTVTGAFSYSGRAIAAELAARGRRVRTLTGHPERAHDDAIEAWPLDFDDPHGLVAALEGTTTLFNTYWVRFAHGTMTHERAVENTKTLFWAARRAGVRKIVHVSILHPSSSSPYPYFRGKALCERALAQTGLASAVLRPSVLFDEHGVLLNNIAWLLRRLPVFAVGGRGDYRVRPIHVVDFASLAVDAAAWTEDRTVDAVGPERPTFNELVGEIRDAVASRSAIVHVPGPALLAGSRALGRALHDIVLTTDEFHSMADGLADSDKPATGHTSLSAWLGEHADELGRTYASELDRHFRH
ncbi:MAG TPA: NAD(P)H-binding protein [Acidimicrobiales bacterium]|nr:NAD(P)H-binding protein [Acidimicrobiales bacterium]